MKYFLKKYTKSNETHNPPKNLKTLLLKKKKVSRLNLSDPNLQVILQKEGFTVLKTRRALLSMIPGTSQLLTVG